MKIVLVALLYNGVWAAAVFGGAAGHSWPGMTAGVLLLVLVAALRGGADARWLMLVVGAGLYGYAADGALAASGLLDFTGADGAWPLPLWMPFLWATFAGCLPVMFRFLAGRPLLSAVIAGIAGPVTYAGAARFGAVAAMDAPAIALVAAEWALFLPLAMAWALPRRAANEAQPAA